MRNGTYDHDAKIDDVPEHFEIVQPEIIQLECFFHRVVDDKSDDHDHAQ